MSPRQPPRPARPAQPRGGTAQGTPRPSGPRGSASRGSPPRPEAPGRHPQRPRRLPGRLRAAFFALVTVVIVAVAGWALFGSHFLVVRSIQVNGTSSPVTRAQVLAAGRIPLGTPLIRVNPGDVARRIERIRQVQSAEVSRDWPDSVAITIRLRAPVFAMAAPGGYALVDSSGVVLRSSATRPRGFPLLVLGGAPGPAGGQPRIRAAAMVLHELPRWITRQVVGVRAAAPADLSLLLANGAVIVWGDPSRPGEKAQELAVLLHTRARLYDVSGPGTAVTRG